MIDLKAVIVLALFVAILIYVVSRNDLVAQTLIAPFRAIREVVVYYWPFSKQGAKDFPPDPPLFDDAKSLPVITDDQIEALAEAFNTFGDAAAKALADIAPVFQELARAIEAIVPVLTTTLRDFYADYLIGLGIPDHIARWWANTIPLNWIPPVDKMFKHSPDLIDNDDLLDPAICKLWVSSVLTEYPFSLAQIWPWVSSFAYSSKTYSEFRERASCFIRIKAEHIGLEFDDAGYSSLIASESLEAFKLGLLDKSKTPHL